MGFKLSREKAIPLSYDTGIAQIETLVAESAPASAATQGSVEKLEILPSYIDHVLGFCRLEPSSAPQFKIVVDMGNGMGGLTAPEALSRLPVDVELLYPELDGSFPNHPANPLVIENLADLRERVTETGADFGVAFDGDADRVAFIADDGSVVPSDLMTALMARDFLRDHPGRTVIFDLRSSWVVAEEVERSGGTPVKSRVGHAFIKRRMRELDAIFAGELSGHYYFAENHYADDGLIALMTVIRLMAREGKSLSRLIEPLQRYHASGEINFRVRDKAEALASLKHEFSDGNVYELDGLSVDYDDWWFNVRPSNTEPLLRLNLEARTAERLDEMRQRLTDHLLRFGELDSGGH